MTSLICSQENVFCFIKFGAFVLTCIKRVNINGGTEKPYCFQVLCFQVLCFQVLVSTVTRPAALQEVLRRTGPRLAMASAVAWSPRWGAQTLFAMALVLSVALVHAGTLRGVHPGAVERFSAATFQCAGAFALVACALVLRVLTLHFHRWDCDRDVTGERRLL